MSSDEITNMLTMTLIIMISVFIILSIVYIVIKNIKMKPKNQNKETMITSNNKKTIDKSIPVSYNKQSIFSFMEFDKIEDNMIIKKNGNNFLMVVECQGVNYDFDVRIRKE